MSAFSFRRDFRSILWGPTLRLNLMRAVAAGVVVAVIVCITGGPNKADVSSRLVMAMVMPLAYPIVYLVFMLPFGLLSLLLASLGVPFVGLISLVMSLYAAIGDPLMFVLSKLKPEWIPVDNFKFLNFVMIMFVLKSCEADVPVITPSANPLHR